MTDVSRASDPGDELEMIGRMLNTAAKHGLEAEVVWSFGNDRAGGSSVAEAIEFALSEWDV